MSFSFEDGKSSEVVERISEKARLTTKKVLILMVSAAIVLAEGVLIIIPTIAELLVTFTWVSVFTAVWGVLLVVYGLAFIIIPILAITGGVSSSILFLLRRPIYRKLMKYLGKYAVWVNIIFILLLMLASFSTGAVVLLWFLFIMLLAHLGLWFFMRPLRLAIQEQLQVLQPL